MELRCPLYQVVIQQLFQAFQADLTVGWQLLISFSCLLLGSSYHQVIRQVTWGVVYQESSHKITTLNHQVTRVGDWIFGTFKIGTVDRKLWHNHMIQKYLRC